MLIKQMDFIKKKSLKIDKMGENTNNGHYGIPTFLNSTSKIVVVTAILYFLIAKLSLFIFVTEINILPFFPAIGFAIAAALLFGRKAILGASLGCFIFCISLYKNDFQNATTFEELFKPLSLCIIRPIITYLNTFLVTYLTQLWCKKKYPFDNEKNVIFFALASLLGTFISVSIGFIPLAMTSYFSLDNCTLIWSNMLRGNALGIILFTPFVLSWFFKTKEVTKWSLSKKAELFLLVISTLSLSLYIFETHANNESILFFLLIWAACRFGMKVITAVALIITIIAIYCTGHHMGGFIFSGWNNDFLMLQSFLFVNMVSVLFLKAVLNEKENEEIKLKISEYDLGLEKNILKATIESPKEVSIFSLDTNLNYLSFNSAHADYMKKAQGADIKIGDNQPELFLDAALKEEIYTSLLNVLKGNASSDEVKNEFGEYLNIARSPIKDNEDKIIGITTIITNVTELKLKEIQLEKNNISLTERIKELRCLYNISEIISNKTLSKFDKLEACVQIIPKALQYPEIANCRIQFKEKEFFSHNYQENDWQLTQTITVNGEKCGSIEVGYFNAKKLEEENVFLDEEIKLLETLSDIISKSLETKVAEEKLLKSEEEYRVLFDNVQDVFFKTSIKTGEILDLSPSCSTFNGILREELIGKNMSIIYSDKDQMQLMFQKIIAEQKVIDFNNEITIKGQLFHVSINAKILFDSKGQPEFAVGSLRNITERRLIEENLKISEEKFRSIFENMQDVYYLHDIDGTLIDISPSVEKHFHAKREDVIGMCAQNFYYEPARYQELIAKILKDGFLNDQEVQFLTATGETLYFSVNSKLINDSNGNPNLVEGTMRNINERINNQNKLIEATEKIKQSEEGFRSIFESFEDLYYRVSLDGYIQNVSPSVEKILKYKREEIIDSYATDLYLNPEDRTKVVETLKENGRISDFETTFKDKDNNPVHLSINAHLVYDSEGNAIFTEGTMRDITQRKENEMEIEMAYQTIKENEKKYRGIFESVRDVFFRASAKDHKIIDISPSCAYFELKAEDIIGKSIQEFYYNPEDRQAVLNELMQNGEIKNYDVKFLLNSKVHNVSINSKIVFDQNNEPEFLIGSFRDVTARIQAEEKLKISEAKFRSIFENFEDVYFRTSMDGMVLDVSPSFEKHFLKPCSFAQENSVFDFYYDKQDREFLLEKLKKEGQIRDYDIRFKDGEGNIVFFSVNARLIYDEKGAPIYIEKSMRNINDRIAFQKEMIVKNRKLEFQNTELEQFAYIASHDLQEPLITVIHCIQLLQEEIAENLDEDQKHYLQFINSSTSRMQVLVKGLLDYSRIGKERKIGSINCNEIVANVLADMDVSLKESNAIVEYENLPVIEGNTTEMRQLFQNMISNANKFRKKDQQPKIKIAAVKEDNNWLFSIEDNGIGIEEQDMDKVFVIFKRLNNRSEYHGTGIGLSHCKKIIEHHRGKIWVESKFNGGSIFKWTFPLEQN
jgi:PAS domain S-box-containing protein